MLAMMKISVAMSMILIASIVWWDCTKREALVIVDSAKIVSMLYGGVRGRWTRRRARMSIHAPEPRIEMVSGHFKAALAICRAAVQVVIIVKTCKCMLGRRSNAGRMSSNFS